ncbi:hypothetical protein EGW08_007468 [Elysia chlorotica]|uniref:Uncharacterized protein n=1 Tax=Elysia chlorotica TaxID=188477 RepID=A0A3S0ZR44_ELYCH|nr:hypothetical protein EGW08_007468 [Elysia chlorotica]
MAATFDEWDWQWEYKHRGLLNYEHRTHHRELLLEKRGVFYDEYGVKLHVIKHCCDEDSEGERKSVHWLEYEKSTKAKQTAPKQPVLVHVLTKGMRIKWSRGGRQGYIHHTEEGDILCDSEESDEDSDEFEECERWPSPAKHKGGRPYEKPDKSCGFFTNKWLPSKTSKRNEWRQRSLDEADIQFFKKSRVIRNDRITIIDARNHKPKKQLRIRTEKREKQTNNLEQTRAERRHRRERNESPETFPPFIEENVNVDEDVSSRICYTAVVAKGVNETTIGHVSESDSTCDETKALDIDKEDDDTLLIKLLRESTRPDTLRTEFRTDYKEATCKPRRFVLNISRIVFHHVTLMNRLRLKAIPKLDLTTYLVFAYCNESTPGVDLFRVHVASTWAGSGESVFANFQNISNGNITSIQELIQCVVSAIDNVDLRRLVAKENMRNKKNTSNRYRPTSNFSMLYSFMKWEFTTTSVPRDLEWYSCQDFDEKSNAFFNLNGLRQLFEPGKNHEALLDNELPDELLSGRKCFNCGRFVRLFVFRKTEPNEFGRPVCLQCAKEDNQNNNVDITSSLNTNKLLGGDTTYSDQQCTDSNITKWYKISRGHRKMRHPEVVKALYGMARIVADKLVCAVNAGKYVGDSKRAASEWDDSLLEWAEDNFNEFCKAQVDKTEHSVVTSSDNRNVSFSARSNTRVSSASSNCSTNSLTGSPNILSSGILRAIDGDDASELSVDMTRAACNIVHLKLELHHIAEYVAVLLDYQVAMRGKLIRCLERAEDLCFSLGILLHDPHVHNAPRILPTFMRLRVQAKHAIENIYNEISIAKSQAILS